MCRSEFERFACDEMARLYRVARRYTSNSDDAEDLVAATLAAAFQALPQFDGRFPLAWILRIMRNTFLKSLRKPIPTTGADDNLTEELTDWRAHQAFISKIESLDILAALDRLPEDYRLAIVLCDMEELDYKEAAFALNVPVGTIRSRVNRGRKQLQAILGTWATKA